MIMWGYYPTLLKILFMIDNVWRVTSMVMGQSAPVSQGYLNDITRKGGEYVIKLQASEMRSLLSSDGGFNLKITKWLWSVIWWWRVVWDILSILEPNQFSAESAFKLFIFYFINFNIFSTIATICSNKTKIKQEIHLKSLRIVSVQWILSKVLVSSFSLR